MKSVFKRVTCLLIMVCFLFSQIPLSVSAEAIPELNADRIKNMFISKYQNEPKKNYWVTPVWKPENFTVNSFKVGSFTKKGAVEALASVHEGNKSHISPDGNGELWQLACGQSWSIGERVDVAQQEVKVDVVDINNDGVLEVLITRVSMTWGVRYIGYQYKLVSLTQNPPLVLFTTVGFDNSQNKVEVGDVVDLHDISFEDVNNDGIKELIDVETKKGREGSGSGFRETYSISNRNIHPIDVSQINANTQEADLYNWYKQGVQDGKEIFFNNADVEDTTGGRILSWNEFWDMYNSLTPQEEEMLKAYLKGIAIPAGVRTAYDLLVAKVASGIAFSKTSVIYTAQKTEKYAIPKVASWWQKLKSWNPFGKKAVEGTIKTWGVDPAMQAADEAAGVLKNGSYIKNPTAQNMNSLIKDGSNYVGNSKFNGQYMYVVDTQGNIVIGSRAGQYMPHPTLVGGSNPQVQAAGIVEIRGGKIYKVDNASGHFKPGAGSLDAAQDAFSKLPSNVFSKDFQGYVPYGK